MEELSCHVALQAADDLLLRQPFCRSSSGIVDGWLVPPQTHDHGSVERCVGLSVSASIQPLSSGGPSRGGGDRTNATKLGECSLTPDSLAVVASRNQELGRTVESNPNPGRKLRRHLFGDLRAVAGVWRAHLVEPEPTLRTSAEHC